MTIKVCKSSLDFLVGRIAGNTSNLFDAKSLVKKITSTIIYPTRKS